MDEIVEWWRCHCQCCIERCLGYGPGLVRTPGAAKPASLAGLPRTLSTCLIVSPFLCQTEVLVRHSDAVKRRAPLTATYAREQAAGGRY